LSITAINLVRKLLNGNIDVIPSYKFAVSMGDIVLIYLSFHEWKLIKSGKGFIVAEHSVGRRALDCYVDPCSVPQITITSMCPIGQKLLVPYC